jgi:hypothetical protein
LPYVSENKKAELTKGLSFGSSAISFEDPPLSAPSLQRGWLYRENNCLTVNKFLFVMDIILN